MIAQRVFKNFHESAIIPREATVLTIKSFAYTGWGEEAGNLFTKYLKLNNLADEDAPEDMVVPLVIALAKWNKNVPSAVKAYKLFLNGHRKRGWIGTEGISPLSASD